MKRPLCSFSAILVLFCLGMLGLTAACSSSQIAPEQPQGSLLRQEYLSAMRNAQSDPNDSCQRFISLGKNQAFPLRPLAQLRAFEVCQHQSFANEKKLPSEFLETLASPPTWLSEIADLAQLNFTEPQSLERAELLIRISKKSIPQSKKVQLVQDAIQIAKAAGQTATVKTYTDRLFLLAPRFLPTPQKPDWLNVGKDFTKNQEYKEGRKYFIQILNNVGEAQSNLASEAFQELAKNYKLAGDKSDYLKTLANYTRYIQKSLKGSNQQKALKSYHDASLELARRYWTDEETENAIKELVRLESMLKGKYPLSRIFWLRGRIFEGQGKFDLALAEFEKALAEKDRKKTYADLKPELAWYAGWNARKLKLYELSIKHFSSVQELKNAKSFPRHLYWQGKTLMDLGNKEDAFDAYQKVIENDPFGYYGALAHRELGKKFSSLNQRGRASTLNRVALSSRKKIELQLDWLMALNEPQVAQQLLESHFQQTGLNKESQKLNTLTLYAKAGLYLPLFFKLASLDDSTRDRLLKNSPDLLFPTPYIDLIEIESEKNKIAPELVLSIIRQESAFNTHARSPADAFGLMQMLFPVAQEMGNELGVQLDDFNKLYEPQTNIALGTRFLSRLFKKNNGQFVPSVSAYNASEKAFLNWVKTRYQGSTEEFIEDIPFAETQGYVKLVMRNYVFYLRMRHQGEWVDFPEWCLSPIQMPAS